MSDEVVKAVVRRIVGEIYRWSFIRTNRVFMRPIGRLFANVKMIDDRRWKIILASGRFRAIFLPVDESNDNSLLLM